MSDITVGEVVVNILNGKLDDGVDRIYDALRKRARMRHQIEGATTLATLKLGDKVELHNIRPQYLNGMTGKVESVRGTKIKIRLDHPEFAPRFAIGGTVTAPASCVKAAA